MIRRGLFAALCLLVFGLPFASPSRADPVESARAAQAALAVGQVEIARLLALAALQEAPHNAEALAVLAAVGLVTGAPDAAAVVAKRAWRGAQEPELRFAASRLVARAKADADKNMQALFWLRRAYDAAPSPALRAQTAAEIRRFRTARPFRLDFSLAVRPSENVNGGSEQRHLTVDGRPTWFFFDPASMALPGVEASSNLGATWRITGHQQQRTELGLRLRHRGVALSERAKAAAPNARGSDFATASLDLSLMHARNLGEGRGLRVGLSYGRDWLADVASADRARADLALIAPISDQRMVRFGAALERQWQANGRASATALVLDAGLQQDLSEGSRLALRLDLGQTISGDANQENRRIGLMLGYDHGQPLAGALLSARVSLSARDYPVFFGGVFNAQGRQDISLAGSLDLALPNLGRLGFEPVISLEASQTRSNISRYEGKALGLGFTLRSAF